MPLVLRQPQQIGDQEIQNVLRAAEMMVVVEVKGAAVAVEIATGAGEIEAGTETETEAGKGEEGIETEAGKGRGIEGVIDRHLQMNQRSSGYPSVESRILINLHLSLEEILDLKVLPALLLQ